MEMKERKHKEREEGFTLIEMLIVIVVVGVLTAVAIVGIGGLVDDGHISACQASADAAKAASAVFFANSSPSTFPSDFHNLITPSHVYEIPTGVTPNETSTPAIQAGDKILTGKGWTLTMTAGTATVPPVFTCT
jgi:type IV pilus assembly protein PilA